MVNWNANSSQAGFESAGGFSWAETDPFYVGSTTYHSAWRYANVTVPQAATIDDATHTIVVDADANRADINYYANDVDDAPVINAAGRPSTMTLTTASAVFPTSPGVGSEATDITTIVQEVVNRPGWASGGDMVIVLFEDGTGTYHTLGGTTAEASLDINYTVGGAGLGIPIAMHHYQHTLGG